MMDSSEVLWEGTVGGGCFKSNSNSRKFRLYTVTPDAEGEQVVSMMTEKADRLWLSSREGSVDVMQGRKIVQVNSHSLSLFSGRAVSAFWESPVGDIWIGSWDRGAAVIKVGNISRAVSGNSFSLLVPERLPSSLSIYKFTSDSFGCVWAATSDGL